MAAGEIDIAPVEPQRLTDASAGVDHEDDQRSQMVAASIDQPVSLVKRQPADRGRPARAVPDERRAPSTLGGVFEHCRRRRKKLAIESGVRCAGIGLASTALDRVQIDRASGVVPKCWITGFKEPLAAAGSR